MKIKTALVAAAGIAVGYVYGTRAGRVKFEQLKSRARTLATDPAVQRNLANLAEQAKRSADKMPGPVGPVVRTAADSLQSTLDNRGSEPADRASTHG